MRCASQHAVGHCSCPDVSADPPDTARVHAVCFAARTISPDDPPAAARRQDMRSGCAGHARSMFARRASARAWARRACAGGARRASARARATSQRARRTSIRKAGMPHTLLAALFTSRLCENSNLVRIFQKKNCFSLKKTTVDRGSHSKSDKVPVTVTVTQAGRTQVPSPWAACRPRGRDCGRVCPATAGGTGYRKSEVTKSQRRKPRVHGNAFGGVQRPGNCMSRR